MIIAVTYENGNVFQHFGMATQVKFYDVRDGGIVSSRVETLKSPGHGMIAPVLFGNGAEVVICGHIKPGAANALIVSGLMLCAGAAGDADAAVAAYIDGRLKHDENAIDADEVCGHDGGDAH